MQKPPSTPRHLSLPPLLVWYPPMLRYSRHRPWFRIPTRLPDRGERGQISWTSVRAVDLSFFLVAGLHDLPVRSVATSQLLAILFASKVEYSHLTHTERCSQEPFSFHLDTTSSRENNTLVLRYPRSRGVFLFHNGMQAAGIAYRDPAGSPTAVTITVQMICRYVPHPSPSLHQPHPPHAPSPRAPSRLQLEDKAHLPVGWRGKKRRVNRRTGPPDVWQRLEIRMPTSSS